MSIPEVYRSLVQRILIVSIFSLLTACGGGTTEALNNLNQLLDNVDNSDPSSDTQFMVSGSVGDGPITGATVTIKAADGTVLATAISDINANYNVMVPQQATYPYIITSTSGIDLVTGTAPTFDMVSIVTSPNDTSVNINPFTTLIVKTAQAMPGGLTATNLDMANQIIIEELNFGLDTSLVPNPITTPVADQNVATIVKASEVLAEMIRRTQTALQVVGNDISQNDILLAIADDMTDGFMDGIGTANASPLVAATANIVSGQVLVEALSNNLKVNGAWATDLLDNAIFASVPGAVITTADLPVTAEMLTQAEAAIAAAQAIAPSTALTNVATILANLLPGTFPSEVETVLPPEMSNDIDDATTLIVMSTDSQLQAVNSSAKQSRMNAPPKVSFTANPATVDYNGATTLSWTSTNAVSCSAVEGWSTTHATSGSVIVGPLTVDTTFTLNCISVNSKITSKSASVTVLPDDSGDTGGEPTPGEDTPPLELLNVVSVTASNYDAAKNRVPENAIDGDLTTFCAMLETPQWIMLDLGTSQLVSKTRVSFYGYDTGRIYDYSVESSLDNANWTLVADHVQSAATQWTELTFNEIEARYIRITLNSANTSDFATIYEIEIYGQNSSSGANPDMALTLNWNANPDDVLGYIVYSGPTADTATEMVSDIPVNSSGFDSQAPSATFQSWSDLGILPGDTICFSVRAYNSIGLSGWPAAQCTVL